MLKKKEKKKKKTKCKPIALTDNCACTIVCNHVYDSLIFVIGCYYGNQTDAANVNFQFLCYNISDGKEVVSAG